MRFDVTTRPTSDERDEHGDVGRASTTRTCPRLKPRTSATPWYSGLSWTTQPQPP